MAPMRADVATLLARIERAEPEGDAAMTAGEPAPVEAEAHH
jgi:NADH-quinone oxidoreductase subunit M